MRPLSATPARHVFFSFLMILQVGSCSLNHINENIVNEHYLLHLPLLGTIIQVGKWIANQIKDVLILIDICHLPTCVINRNEKKRAEQVLQTTFSLIWFEIHLPTCNIIRNEKKNVPSRCCRQRSHWHCLYFNCPPVIPIGMKKTCRAGVADNGLIHLVWTSYAHL